MHSKTLKRFLGYSLLLAVLALPAASAKPQQRKALPVNDQLPIIKGDCPRPMALTITATNPPNFFTGDFSSAQVAAHVGFNYPGPDKHFLYTFQWKRQDRCCQITKAELIVDVRANQGGQSNTSSDAGNDGIAIMHSGTSLQSEAVYNQWPFNTGLLLTKHVILNQAALNSLNATGQLSFAVQDDTSVLSATLQLSGCCLTVNTPVATDYATQKECEAAEKQACSIQYGAWHRTN